MTQAINNTVNQLACTEKEKKLFSFGETVQAINNTVKQLTCTEKKTKPLFSSSNFGVTGSNINFAPDIIFIKPISNVN